MKAKQTERTKSKLWNMTLMQLKTRRTRITESYYRECPRSEKRFRKDFFFGKGQLWNQDSKSLARIVWIFKSEYIESHYTYSDGTIQIMQAKGLEPWFDGLVGRWSMKRVIVAKFVFLLRQKISNLKAKNRSKTNSEIFSKILSINKFSYHEFLVKFKAIRPAPPFVPSLI